MSRKIKKNKNVLGIARSKRMSMLSEMEKYKSLGDNYSNQGDNRLALEQYLIAWKISPGNFSLNESLGNIYARLEQYDKSAQHFSICQKIDPDNQGIEYVLSCLSCGKILDKAPHLWVTNVFDNMAGSFEQHLTSLKYKIPNEIRTVFDQISESNRRYDCLDLGCGTGLSGLAFYSICNNLVGVDISKKMILEAEKKNIYNEIINSDIADSFSKLSGKFDLFLSTDVFIYIGNLDDVFEKVKEIAKPNAYFLFSIERLSEENMQKGFKSLPSGRYAHSLNYIQILSERNEFEIISQKNTLIREENGKGIEGNVFILKTAGCKKNSEQA